MSNIPITNKIVQIIKSKNLVQTVNFILLFLLLITIICVFVPFTPIMPAVSPDLWIYGIDQAMIHGLSFGKDIIFTFGPYASIFTKTYLPSTDFIMLIGSLYLALSYFGCFILIMKNTKLCWILLFCIILAGLMNSRDALLFFLPLLVGLVVFKLLFWKDGNLVKNKWSPLYIGLLFVSFGLLPLIKVSLLLPCILVAILCAIIFVINRHKFLAVVCLLVPIISTILFWILAGQSLVSLPDYFISTIPIISGYTEAMSFNGFFPKLSIIEVILYLFTSVLLLISISIQTQIKNTSKIFLFCIYFIFLFFSFKAGFVQHGTAHALIPGTSILFAALLLIFIFNSKFILPNITFAFITFIIILSHYNCGSRIKTLVTEHKLNVVSISSVVVSEFLQNFTNNIKSTYLLAGQGIVKRIENKNWLKQQFDVTEESLRKVASFPVLQGTTDIYPSEIHYLFPSENVWSPRPIFQSYSAYTPALSEINRAHLLGSHAPDNIIFEIAPLLERIPSIDDGTSWPILMTNYEPIYTKNNFLFLKKKSDTSNIVKPLLLISEKHIFGESVSLPYSKEPIFVQIDIKPTILGRIANILYKSSQLCISLELKNGTQKQYRIVAEMSESGFLISPLIENTDEFAMLYGKKGLLDNKLVKSLTIISVGGSIFWNKNYTITFSQIKL